MNYELEPVPFKQANDFLRGRDITEEEKQVSTEHRVKDIPCYKDDTVVVTQWKLEGFRNRLRFLLTGTVSVVVLGTTQPPMTIRIDNPFNDSK